MLHKKYLLPVTGFFDPSNVTEAENPSFQVKID